MKIPEPLKYQLAGYWSRRINRKDQIIYKVYEDRVFVLVVSAGKNGSSDHLVPVYIN